MLRRRSKKKKTRCLSEGSNLQHHQQSHDDTSSPLMADKMQVEGGDDKFPEEIRDTYETQTPSTVEAIVLQCAECFDDKTGHCSSPELPKKLFLIHLWFMTSEQLMFLFKQLYIESEKNPDLQKKVLHAIAFWMMEYPFIFDLDASVSRALGDLQNIVAQSGKGNEKIINLKERCSYKWMSAKQMSIRPNLQKRRRKLSLVFNHLEPQDLAIHISYLEYKCFRRLTVDDFHNYAMRGTIKGNLKLERAVILFNNITHWVQCMVLKETIPHERAQAVKKFVDVARYLLKMHNYNTLLAIIGALTHTTISRLRKTTAELPKDTIKELEGYIELMDSKSNYSAYRRSFTAVTDHFKIPILGVVLKDLIAIHTANPDRIGEGLINVKKMFTLGKLFQELLGLQLKKTQYPFEVNTDLVNTLQGSLYLNYSENEIYQLSLNREPKESRFKLGSKAKSCLELNNLRFAEFTRYTCQLDQEIVKQHVEAMVKSVFKTYDTDKDGSLSEDDYGLLSLNFPALDPFSTVDKNKDGKICMEELMEYLMISSSRRKEVCLSFQHTFIETTYRSLTFCDQCNKLMWGIVKQGWKCKECGINCHKYCKSRIVQECRRKGKELSSEGTAPYSKNPEPQTDDSMNELIPRKGSQPVAPDIIIEKPLRKWRSANDGMNVEEQPSSSMGGKLKNIVTKYVDKKRIKRRMSTNTRVQMKSSISLASGLTSSSRTSLDVFSPISSESLSIPSPNSDTVFVMDPSTSKDHRDSGFGGCSTPSGSSCTSIPSPSEAPGRFLFPSTSSIANTQTNCGLSTEIIVNSSRNEDTNKSTKSNPDQSLIDIPSDQT